MIFGKSNIIDDRLIVVFQHIAQQVNIMFIFRTPLILCPSRITAYQLETYIYIWFSQNCVERSFRDGGGGTFKKNRK